MLNAFKNKEVLAKNLNNLPFSNYEAKIISAFIFHQKLSDLIYTIETQHFNNNNQKDIYNKIYDLNYESFLKKYLLVQ